MNNCDIWGFVDFGLGLVKIRCTEPGEHTQHKCLVLIDVESSVLDQTVVNDPSVSHQNIFDKYAKE